MAAVVFVHGIAQEHCSADVLEAEWLPALAGGVRLAGFPDIANRIWRQDVQNFTIGKIALEMTSTVVDRRVKFVFRVRNFGTDFSPVTAWIEKNGDVFKRKIMELGVVTGTGPWHSGNPAWPPRLDNGVAIFEVIFTRQ